MTSNLKRPNRLAGLILFVTTAAIDAVAQLRLPGDPEPAASSPGIWPYVIILVILASVGTAFYFWKKKKDAFDKAGLSADSTYSEYYSSDTFEMGDVDADKELEWLRKAKKSSKKQSLTYEMKKPETKAQNQTATKNRGESQAEAKAFQEKMKMLQYAQLPINSFGDLMPPKQPELLLDSYATTLLDAIEQTNPDVEDDESVRDVSIKVLASFRTGNSVEALTQIALYDLSASLRSKAVTVLADFDHESVFEPILLACADPTREVRAAAARALFRLNFDRSGAWRRIIETKDEFRMSQAVRAAVEAGIAVKSFDRLVHEDPKVAYEAFTLVALMVKAGETNEIFEAICSHKDERVKFALLHVLKAIKDERSMHILSELLQIGACSNAVLEKAKDVMNSIGVTAKNAA